MLRAVFELSRVLENALRIAEGTPVTKYALFGVLLLLGGANAFAQSADKEPKELAVVELGAAAGWNIASGGSNVAPTAAVEATPIEKWLELEAGVTPIFSRHSTEWDVDLLFKKPWTLSKKVEFMAGVGPEWVHVRQGGVTTNSVAGEVVLDFMFWPSKKRRFGWYLEPGYEYGFGRAHERSAGLSGGLLIAIPWP
ncbi:MAG TPA: hypothetical protein VN902_22390 [Candidatus Acidoferrales bacterium]|nr:hypothetical protein [Candidatus Acidoferrales bacterium]